MGHPLVCHGQKEEHVKDMGAGTNMEYLGDRVEFSGLEWDGEHDGRRGGKSELRLHSEGPWVPLWGVWISSCWEWRLSIATQEGYLFLVKGQTQQGRARQSQSPWSQWLPSVLQSWFAPNFLLTCSLRYYPQGKVSRLTGDDRYKFLMFCFQPNLSLGCTGIFQHPPSHPPSSIPGHICGSEA